MIQLSNTQRRLKEIRRLQGEFKAAFGEIEAQRDDRNGIFRDVHKGTDNLFTIKPFRRDSASDSIYFGAQSNDRRFFSNPVTAFVKAYENASVNETMRVETCIYKNVIS